MQRSFSNSSSQSDGSDLSSPDSQSTGRTFVHPLPSHAEEGADEGANLMQRGPLRRSTIEEQFGPRLHKLRDALRRYFDHRKKLSPHYAEIRDVIGRIIDKLGENDDLADSLKSIVDLTPVEGFIKNDPVILVSGQVNCGKSALINEILEKTVVPSEKTPSTAMITKLKFSEDDYYQIFNKDGTPKTVRKVFNRKELQADMMVRHSERTSEKVQATVEVGLNNPVLGCGIQIYDTPGRNENEALDAAVHEALNGMSQVLIYILDANQSFRLEDERFLRSVLDEYPQLHVLYVCNKCDDVAKARAMDTVSDDEEDVWVLRNKLPKGEDVYQRLCKFKQISRDAYFQISCTEIAKARRKRRHNTCLDEFLRFINALIERFECCVYEHLHRALDSMYALATCAFDYFVSGMYLHQPVWENISRKLVVVTALEQTAQSQVTARIEEQREQLSHSLKMIISEKKESIVERIQKSVETQAEILSQKKLVKITQRVIFDEIVNHTKAFDEITSCIQREVWDKMDALLTDCNRQSGVGDLIPQLRNCFRFEISANKQSRMYKVISRKSLAASLKDIVAKVLCKIPAKGNEKLRETLRHAVVARLVQGVDGRALAAEVAHQLTAQFLKSHDRFNDLIKIIQQAHCSRKEKQRDLHSFIGPLSVEICQLRALKCLAEDGEIRLASEYRELKQGHRNEVYTFGFGTKRYAVKRLIHGINYDANLKELCITLNNGRLLQLNHPHILSSFDLRIDGCGYLVLQVPYCQSNLFLGLIHEMQLPIKDRMLMARNIADACVYLAERRFRASDLRPNNILLDRWQPKIDLSKWKCLETPYPEPDNKPAFHFAPEVISGTAFDQIGPSTYDTFSCTMLLWFLSVGKFIRPNFAQHDSVDEIYFNLLSDICRVRGELLRILDESQHARPETQAVFGSICHLLQQNIDKNYRRMSIGAFRDAMDDLCKLC